jgi:hypothetical protein
MRSAMHLAAQRNSSRLRVVRMALLGSRKQNLRFQNSCDPLFAHVLNDAFPLCPGPRDALMHPQTIDLDHGRPLFDSLEKHVVGPS